MNLISPRLVFFSEHEQIRSRLPLLFAQSLKAQHSHDFGPACAVDDLLAPHSSTGPKANTVDLPAVIRLRYCLREFVVRDLDAGLGALLFGENRVKKLVGINLILPVTLRDSGEVRKLSAIDFHALLHQLPTDAGDHLLSPRIEQTRKCHTTSRRCAAELTVAFHNECLRSGPPCLNRRDMTSRSAANHKHIHFVGHFRLGRVRDCLSRHMRGRSDGQPRRCRADNGLLQELAASSV